MKNFILILTFVHIYGVANSKEFFSKLTTPPKIDINTAYLANSIPNDLGNTLADGINDICSPEIINTQRIGITQCVFMPLEGACGRSINSNVNVLSDTDTTVMGQSAVWYSTTFTGDFWEGDCSIQIVITRVMRDTLIGDRLARIVGVTKGGIYYPESEVPFYEKAGKMYFYEEDDWRLLYDFTAEAGDTISYYISKKFPYYNLLGFIEMVEFLSESQLVIKSIDTIYTEEGNALKRFETELVSGDWNRMDYIIERMGSVNHLFGMTYIPFPFGCSGAAMRCYIDEKEHLKFTEDECDKISTVTDVQFGDVAIYPNPAYDRLEASLTSLNIVSGGFAVHNIHGNVLMTGSFEGESGFELDLSDLLPGMYFLQILGDNHSVLTKKFIKF